MVHMTIAGSINSNFRHSNLLLILTHYISILYTDTSGD